jgi:hypothetical protein
VVLERIAFVMKDSKVVGTSALAWPLALAKEASLNGPFGSASRRSFLEKGVLGLVGPGRATSSPFPD